MPEHILVVEDDRELREMLLELLRGAGYEASGYGTAANALKALEPDGQADLVITDLIMPGLTGDELLKSIRGRWPQINVIVLTAFGSIDSAIELVKLGAFDYLTKPVGTAELLLAVERALKESGLRRELAALARGGAGLPAGMVGASRQMQELASLIRRAAASPHAVLITGESGTGKELVARALHDASGRGPFVAVNCGAIPEQLLESELFGHQRGAFTGADQTHRGLFETADHGTLLLDEIGELPLALQPKLLRALESGEVRRVGATQETRVDVRILAATNRDLAGEVKAGRFREDLFWRLNVLHVHVPPLRERPADVLLLAEHFLREAARNGTGYRLAPETVGLLTGYEWPGNVRELRNAIQRAATLAVSDTILPTDLPERIQQRARVAGALSSAALEHRPLRDIERTYVLEILREVGGNKSRAAEILGLDRKTLYRKLEEYRQDGDLS